MGSTGKVICSTRKILRHHLVSNSHLEKKYGVREVLRECETMRAVGSDCFIVFSCFTAFHADRNSITKNYVFWLVFWFVFFVFLCWFVLFLKNTEIE